MILVLQINSKSQQGGIRTPGSTLAAFESSTRPPGRSVYLYYTSAVRTSAAVLLGTWLRRHNSHRDTEPTSQVGTRKSRSRHLKTRTPVALERQRLANNMRTYRSLRCIVLKLFHSPCSQPTVPDSIRPTQFPPSLQFESSGTQNHEKSPNVSRNNEIPGQATAGQLRRSSCLVSVRVFNGTGLPAPFSAVSIWYSHSLTRSTKRCHDAAFKVNSFAKQYVRTPNYINNKQQVIVKPFPISEDLIIFSFFK